MTKCPLLHHWSQKCPHVQELLHCYCDQKIDDLSYWHGMQHAWRVYHADAHAANTTFQTKISPRAKSLFSLIDLVMNGNNSLSICSNPLHKKYISLEEINCHTLHKYTIMLADIVGEKIKDKIQKVELHHRWLGSNWCPLCCNLSLLAYP